MNSQPSQLGHFSQPSSSRKYLILETCFLHRKAALELF